MPLFLDLTDFFDLRLQVDNLAQARAPQRRLEVEFPHLPGGAPQPGEVVEVGEALRATLTAVSAASRRLKGHSMGIDLGSKPLQLQFTGRLLGILPESGQVLVQIAPQGKKATNAD